MIHIHDVLRERLLSRIGIHPAIRPKFSYADLRRTEWSSEFEEHMREHLVMGALRYGVLHDTHKPTKKDRVGSMERRLKLYQASGNKRLLVDVANLCLLEFTSPAHAGAHWSHDDTGEHVQVKR